MQLVVFLGSYTRGLDRESSTGNLVLYPDLPDLSWERILIWVSYRQGYLRWKIVENFIFTSIVDRL